jgi:glutathione-regulated potassium-efflux system ancillary protein KefC
VYYGDATGLDLLHAAGAAHAKLLVVAIDDPDASVRLVESVREHFPKLPIVARARNVPHWQRLRSRRRLDRGARDLRVGDLDRPPLARGAGRARLRGEGARRRLPAAQPGVPGSRSWPVWATRRQRTNLARSARDQLEQQMERDRAELDRQVGNGWHSEAEAEEEGGDQRSPAAR